MMRRTSFGLQYAISGLGQLGSLSLSQQESLQVSIEPVYLNLENAQLYLNRAAQTGFDRTRLVIFQQELDAERAQVDALAEQIPNLQNDEQIARWQNRLGQLFQNTGELRGRVLDAINESAHSTLWKVGLWTGAGVIGALGAAVLVRYYSRRRRRR